MKPTLIVEGVTYNVDTLHFVNGEPVTAIVRSMGMLGEFHNIDHPAVENLGTFFFVSFKKSLKNGRDSELIKLINKKIEGYEEILTDYSHSFLLEHLNDKKLPFITERAVEIVEEYEKFSIFVEQLEEIKDFIKGGE